MYTYIVYNYNTVLHVHVCITHLINEDTSVLGVSRFNRYIVGSTVHVRIIITARLYSVSPGVGLSYILLLL